jgi:hypothetical protein
MRDNEKQSYSLLYKAILDQQLIAYLPDDLN